MPIRAAVPTPAIQITERELDRQVMDLAKVFGWSLSYHTWVSVKSAPGFPDRVFVRPPRILFVEEKAEKGKVSPAQEKWAEALKACPGVEYVLLRPSGLEEFADLLR
jgi:hypothetical protein